MSIQIREATREDLDQMIAEHRTLNPDLPIRSDIKAALELYAFDGYPLGDFLTAVVENDLFEAIGRADSYNRATIWQICSFIWNELPSTCWGNPEKVKAHLESFREQQ